MAFDVSALTNYTKEHEGELLVSSMYSGKTQQLIQAEGNVQAGIKSSERLHYLDTTVTFQAGGTCGFNALDTTSFSTRDITVGKIKINEQLCIKDLETKWTQEMLPKGSVYDSIPFEQKYTDRKAQIIATYLEKAIWQGDTSSGDANLNKFDGLLKIIDAATANTVVNAKTGTGTITTTADPTVTGTSTNFNPEVGVGDKLYSGTTYLGTVASITNDTALELTGNAAANVTGAAYTIVPAAAYNFGAPITSVTTSNVIAAIDSVWASLPAAMMEKDDLRIFVPTDMFVKYVLALRAANFFHYDAANANGELTIPGTNYKITAVHGLDGTNRVVALSMSNIFLGVDMLNEEEKFYIWYSEDDDLVKFKAEFKMGVQLAFPDEVVSFKLAA